MKLTQELFHQKQTARMPPALQGVELNDLTVVVTGGNTGLGFQAAKHFAQRLRGPDAKLVILCRNEEKGRLAVEVLKSETGFQNIEFWISDLKSFDSVKSITPKIKSLERLDILVENAGIGLDTYEVTSDGWEATLQVNVLSQILRTFLHLPKMLETAEKYPEHTPRIVFVSSGANYMATIPEEAFESGSILRWLSKEREGAQGRRYHETKLLQVAFIRHLQRRLSSITCCALEPGFCITDLSLSTIKKIEANPDAVEPVLRALSSRDLAFSAEEGSRNILFAAAAHQDAEEMMKGAYVAYGEITECSDYLLSEEGRRLEEKLWGEVVELVLPLVDESTKKTIVNML